MKTIRNFLKNDDYIPNRFAIWNAVLLGCGWVILGSKKIIIKATGIALEGVCAFAMNREMAKFMECVLHERRRL